MRKLNDCQKVVNNIVAHEFTAKNDRYFWPREMKFARELIKLYGLEFMLWLKPPQNYKVASLLWLKTGFGKDFLSDQKVEYAKEFRQEEKKEQIELTSSKIGEDIVIKKEPKSLKDFLNLYVKS